MRHVGTATVNGAALSQSQHSPSDLVGYLPPTPVAGRWWLLLLGDGHAHGDLFAT
jgi:hypothetical protein